MKTHIMRNCRDLCEEAEAEAVPQNSKARASNNPHSHRPTRHYLKTHQAAAESATDSEPA